MPRVRLPQYAGIATAALAAALGVWPGAPSAFAQAIDLRGAAGEPPEPQGQALGGVDGLRQRTYDPFSTGASPDDRDRDSLFAVEEDAADGFAVDAPRPAARPPSPAADRTEAATAVAPSRPAAAEPAADEEPDPGFTRTGTVDSLADDELDAAIDREEAIERIDRQPEADPYAPLGVRLGGFLLRPSLEQGLTATSNSDSSADGESALLSETTLRLNAISDWKRHAARINAYGIFRESISGAEESDREAGVDAELEVELGNEYRLRAGLDYVNRPEGASSPIALVGTASSPIRQTLTSSLGLEKDVGKARLGVTGAVTQDWYGEATLSEGGTLSQRERDSTLGSVTLRGGYEVSPALTPFAEVEVGRRVYDLRYDASDFERSSTRLGARAGLAFDLGEKLSGETSAGWIREGFDDDRLEPLSGPTIAGDLLWSPMRGTLVGLSGSTLVEATTSQGESGSILYSSRLTIDREIRANLTGNLAFGLAWRDYVSSESQDLTLAGEAGLAWALNRNLALTGRLRHETVASNIEGRDAETNSIFFGMRVQR